MNNDLEYSLGLNVTGFKASAGVVDEQTKALKRGFEGFRDVITFGGVGLIVLDFFRDVVSYAQNASGAIDENTAAVKRFADGLDETRQGSLSWGAQILGVINRSGEGLGLLTRTGIEATEKGFWGSLIRGDISSSLTAIKGAFDDVRSAHQRDVEVSKEEVRVESLKAKYGEDNKRILAETSRLAQQERDFRLSTLTRQERVNQLTNEHLELQRQLSAFEGDAVPRRDLENKTRAAGLALLRAQHDLLKENEQGEKQAAAAAKQAAADREKFLNEEAKRVKEIAALRLKGVENLTTAERLQLDLLEGRVKQRDLEHEAQQLLLKGVEMLTDVERERLALLTGQTVEMKKQNDELKEQEKTVIGINVRGFNQFKQASEEALQALIDQSKSQIQRIKESLFTQGALDSFTGRLDIARLQQEIANARQELEFRQSLQRDLALGGEDFARRNFRGDALAFDEVLQRVAGNWSRQDETNQQLQTLNRQLRDGIDVRPVGAI